MGFGFSRAGLSPTLEVGVFALCFDFDKIIEYTLCLKAINGLVKTGKELTVTSTNTLEEVSRMYNGNNTASYMSGCGFFYNTFSQDVEDNIESFLYIYVEHYIDECFRHGLFPNYLTNSF